MTNNVMRIGEFGLDFWSCSINFEYLSRNLKDHVLILNGCQY